MRTSPTARRACGLEVHDVSEPGNPRHVGFLESQIGHDAIVQPGETACIAGDVSDDEPVLQRVDVADPGAPRVVDPDGGDPRLLDRAHGRVRRPIRPRRVLLRVCPGSCAP
jgi:hypothetical protein